MELYFGIDSSALRPDVMRASAGNLSGLVAAASKQSVPEYDTDNEH